MTIQQLLTVTLSTGETVLARKEITVNTGMPVSLWDHQLAPLRYGNLTSAEKKLNLIQPLLSPARSASIVKLGGRFLILIYDKPGYQSSSLSDIEHTMLKRSKSIQGRGRIFATTSGRRYNPRNRHNHAHKDQTDKPYHFGG